MTTITDIFIKYGVPYSIFSDTDNILRIRVIEDVGADCLRELLQHNLKEISPAGDDLYIDFIK